MKIWKRNHHWWQGGSKERKGGGKSVLLYRVHALISSCGVEFVIIVKVRTGKGKSVTTMLWRGHDDDDDDAKQIDTVISYRSYPYLNDSQHTKRERENATINFWCWWLKWRPIDGLWTWHNPQSLKRVVVECKNISQRVCCRVVGEQVWRSNVASTTAKEVDDEEAQKWWR